MSIQAGSSSRDNEDSSFKNAVSTIEAKKKEPTPIASKMTEKPSGTKKDSGSEDKPEGAKEEAVKFLSNAVKQTGRKKLPKRELGHTPRREVDKELIERNNQLISEVYDNYEGDSVDELAQLLTKKGLHVHIEKDAKDRVTPVARVFYHDPVVAIIREKEQLMLDGFFHDLKAPKPEPEEEVEEAPKKKRFFGKKRS